MKLRDLIKNRDYSFFEKCGYSSFYNYYNDTLMNILYPNSSVYYIDDEVYDQIENSGRLQVYAIREWICTDTHVGLYLYILDGIPVCTSYQSSRKSEPSWNFFDADCLRAVRSIFDEFMKEDEPFFTGMNEDLMHLEIHNKLFDSKITWHQMGLSNFVDYKGFLDSFLQEKRVINDLNRDSIVEILEDLICDYEEMLSYHEKNDPANLKRFTDSGSEDYEKAKTILRHIGINRDE